MSPAPTGAAGGGVAAAPPPAPAPGPGRPWPPPAPPALKVVGGIGIALGAVNAVLNLVLPVLALPQLRNNAGAELALWAVLIAGGAGVLVSLLQMAGGLGLVRGRLWGRRLSIVAAGLSLLVAFAGILAGPVIRNLIEVQGGAARSFEVRIFGACGLPLFAPALMIVLLTEDVRRWAAELKAGPGADPAKLQAAARLNVMAPLSLFLGLVPMQPLPVVALVLGILALRQIARSGGKERGRGLAIAGVVFAGFWLLVTLAAITMVIVLVATDRM